MTLMGQRFAYRERTHTPGDPEPPVEVVKEDPRRSHKVRDQRLPRSLVFRTIRWTTGRSAQGGRTTALVDACQRCRVGERCDDTLFYALLGQRHSREGADIGGGQARVHGAGNGFVWRGVSVGDMVYPVTVTDGVLRLLGSLEVGRVCDLEAAREELGYEPRWKARDYLLAFDLYDYDDERDAGTYYAEAGSLGGKFALTPTQVRATPRANQRED